MNDDNRTPAIDPDWRSGETMQDQMERTAGVTDLSQERNIVRIYLLSEGSVAAPTETVKSVHTRFSSAIAYADETYEVPIGKWEPIVYDPPDADSPRKMWVATDTYWTFYITEWETTE